MKFSIKDFFSKCDQIRSYLWISSRLLKKSLMENFIFCAVYISLLSKVDLLENLYVFYSFKILPVSNFTIINEENDTSLQ